MPRLAWTKEEDMALVAGVREYGDKWRLIKQKYPMISDRHPSPTALKDRVRFWRNSGVFDDYISGRCVPQQAIQLVGDAMAIEVSDVEIEAQGDVQTASNEAPAETMKDGLEAFEDLVLTRKAPVLGFLCDCGQEHTFASLLTLGLECQCSRDLNAMILQVTSLYPWAVYILLEVDNSGLTDAVRYVGTIDKHVKVQNTLQNATFDDLRVSLILGESQLVELLKPYDNKPWSAHQSRNLCRLKGAEGLREVHVDMQNGTQGYLKEFKHTGRRGILSQEYEATAGILFSAVAARRAVHDIERNFCFKRGQDTCICQMQCHMRKVLNHLRGREPYDGIPRNEVKDSIRPFREIVSYRGPSDLEAEWTPRFTEKVLQRKCAKAVTVRRNQEETRLMWKRGMMKLFKTPWLLVDALQRSGTRNTHAIMFSTLSTILSHMTNAEVKRVFGSVVASTLRREFHQVGSMLKELQQKDEQQRSPRERSSWASVDEIRAGINRMAAATSSLLDQQRVLWYRMVLIQGTVRNDYRTLKVMKFDRTKDNYVDLVARQIVLNEYKTSNVYGRRTMDIKPELLDSIATLYVKRCELGHEYLFARKNGEQYTSSGFASFVIEGLKKHVGGKRIGSSMLRKIVITEALKGEKSLAEKRAMADEMQHSTSMQAKYIRFE